jgi:hypothetical protein
MDNVVHPPQQTVCFPVNSGLSFRSSAATRLYSLSAGVVCRAVLMAIFVTLSHEFGWGWLRLLTSEAVLRISAALGMAAERASFDTIRVEGELFRFVISCTYADVFMGMIPFVWRLKKSVCENFLMHIALAVSLFGVNVLRLEVGQLLYACGTPWIVADKILGGFAYFGIWLFINWWLGLSRLIGCLVAPQEPSGRARPLDDHRPDDGDRARCLLSCRAVRAG